MGKVVKQRKMARDRQEKRHQQALVAAAKEEAIRHVAIKQRLCE